MQEWRDDRLRWVPRDFAGLRSVQLLPDEVWTPGVSINLRSTSYMNIFISPEAAQRKRILTIINTNKILNNNYYHLKELLKKTRNRLKK